jgi:hypothetical protein
VTRISGSCKSTTRGRFLAQTEWLIKEVSKKEKEKKKILDLRGFIYGRDNIEAGNSTWQN